MLISSPFNNTLIAVLLLTVSACSQQNWYQGAKSAQAGQCLNEPLSQHETCNQRSDKNFDEYDKNREELLKDNETKQYRFNEQAI